MGATIRFVVIAIAVAGCGVESGSGGIDLGAGGGSGGGGDDADLATPSGAPDLGVAAVCTDGDAYCKSWNVRTSCQGGAWVDDTCTGGCSAGACAATACADECALGATSPSGTCKLWDAATGAFVANDASARLHDRARDYDALRRAHQLIEGAVCNAVYTDATRATISFYSGTGDAALWSGTSLAAEAWRYQTTGAPDAAAELARLAATLHRLFNVAGEPAYLARLAVPTGDTTPLEDASRCTTASWHCSRAYAGASWDWLGHTSRDAYTGVMLGYDAAYAATRDESVRAAIRADVVAVAVELMKDRMVPATVTVQGIPIDKTLALSNVILSPSEMTNGRVTITVGGSNELYGAREFVTDMSPVLAQVLGVSPPIPRPSSAMMLGAFFRMALAMTAGVAGQEAMHAALAAYYDAHADAWLDVAAQWSFSANCGNGYYANHIAFIMAYVWARLETDAARRARIADSILDGRMWAALSGQKNAYFAFLWGATRAQKSPAPAGIAAAANQLAQFPVGPRVHVAVDHSADPKYQPHDASCTSEPMADTATSAVDVRDRVIDDFLWQRGPWRLVDGGNLAEVYPGVDYLAAYWAARADGFIADDAPTTCARWSK
jgi:hypothetical protein